MRTVHVDVLRAAEPLSLPRLLSVRVDGGVKRVPRMRAPLTAAGQGNDIRWTPHRGTAALAGWTRTRSDDELLDYIQASGRLPSWALARQAGALHEFSTRRRPVPAEVPPVQHPDRSRYAAGEIMALFAISVGAAEHPKRRRRTARPGAA